MIVLSYDIVLQTYASEKSRFFTQYSVGVQYQNEKLKNCFNAFSNPGLTQFTEHIGVTPRCYEHRHRYTLSLNGSLFSQSNPE